MTRVANRMQEATDRLMDRFVSHASILVDYKNGAEEATGVSATVGRTPFEMDDGGVLVAYESRDYILAVADLVDDTTGDPIVPASGATITEQETEKAFSVAAPKGVNVYETIGPNGSVFKIHTKA